MKNNLATAIETIAFNKSLSIDRLYAAMEEALSSVTSKNTVLKGAEHNIRAHINRVTGELQLKRVWTVVADDELESEETQITLSDAKVDYPNIVIGDEIEELLDNPDLSRKDYYNVRQILLRIVNDAARETVAENYRSKLNTILVGKVTLVTRDYIRLWFEEGVEGILYRNDILDRDIFRIDDKIRALLVEVSPDRKLMLRLSRIDNNFLIELLKQEVPECAEGMIQIKVVAREPGSRAKVAVKTNDMRIDPLGACIGARGSRILSITNELNGERIDVLLWNDDIAEFAINALAPAKINSITVNEFNHSMDISVHQDQLANAIGRGGQNIKLASQLVGWKLNVMTDTQAENKQKTLNMLTINLFTDSLDIDVDVANILIREGYGSIEEIIASSVSELASIEEFDQEIAEALIERAKLCMVRNAISGTKNGISDLYELDGLEVGLAEKLINKNINTKDDLAELSVDELLELVDIDAESAAALILAARRDWFDN